MSNGVYAITGRVGSGKSQAAEMVLSYFDVDIVDLDLLGHQALSEPEIVTQLTSAFGSDILDEEGQVMRDVLGGRVFSDPKKLAQLNAIVHPRIRELTVLFCQEVRSRVVIVGALIDEIGLRDLCDGILVVDAEDDDIRAAVGDKFDRVSPHQKTREAFREMGTSVVTNRFSYTFKEDVIRGFRACLDFAS